MLDIALLYHQTRVIMG